MKRSIWLTLVILILCSTQAEAQIFKKLRKVAEQAAERTIEERVDRETSEKTDQALDSVFDPSIGRQGRQVETTEDMEWEEGGYNEDYSEEYGEEESQEYDEYDSGGVDESIEVYSKFDFVPGDKQLFYDDFSSDFVGDFPARWNTNGTGEVVEVGSDSQKWFEIKSGRSVYYIPDLNTLPEDFTVEFDLLAKGLDRQTASTTVFKIILSDNNGFKQGNYAYAQLSLCQYAAVGLWVRNDRQGIMNEIGADIRDALLNQPHISIAVNGQRFRLWVNEKKVVDIPRLIAEDDQMSSIKFQVINMKDGKERLFLSNLRVAEGGVDLRKKLLSEGKISTNAILFESGSDRIEPQSMGVIRQIYQVMRQDKSLQLNIVGHTDADGDESANMDLSLLRAKAVKDALTSVYGIDGSRLQTQGKGELDPVADNNTAEGKAQNRRVEFVKI